MNVPGKAGEDLLLVSSEACVLVGGQDLVPRWTFSAAQVSRYVFLQELGSGCKLGTAACPLAALG